ncbi:MAG: YhcH/YjgK/YiaL family protein [Cyclobacteriaceae bacterium]
MKHLHYSIFLLIALCTGCSSTEKRGEDPEQWTEDQVDEWFEEKEWLGESRMQPDPHINKRTLAIQYLKNKKRWDAAFDFIRKEDFAGLTVGDHPLDGKDAFARVSEYNSKNPEAAFHEAHRDYTDIHFLISGEEYIGQSSLSVATVRTLYDGTKDIEFYDAADDQKFLAKPGTFFIFFPGEGHRPGMKVGDNAKVKKVVIKVRT